MITTLFVGDDSIMLDITREFLENIKDIRGDMVLKGTDTLACIHSCSDDTIVSGLSLPERINICTGLAQIVCLPGERD